MLVHGFPLALPHRWARNHARRTRGAWRQDNRDRAREDHGSGTAGASMTSPSGAPSRSTARIGRMITRSIIRGRTVGRNSRMHTIGRRAVAMDADRLGGCRAPNGGVGGRYPQRGHTSARIVRRSVQAYCLPCLWCACVPLPAVAAALGHLVGRESGANQSGGQSEGRTVPEHGAGVTLPLPPHVLAGTPQAVICPGRDRQPSPDGHPDIVEFRPEKAAVSPSCNGFKE